MMAETKLWNALNSAFEKGPSLSKSQNIKDNRTKQQKYLDKIELMSENDRSREYINYIFDLFNDEYPWVFEESSSNAKSHISNLFTNKIKWLKDVSTYEMKNGIYKSVIKELNENWVVISIGNFEYEWKNGKIKKKSLDYIVLNKNLHHHANVLDEMYVNFDLNKINNNLTIEEFSLEPWDMCLLKIDKLTNRWVFIKVGQYEWFIPKSYLNNDVKTGDSIYLNVKKIWENAKNKNKDWVTFDVINKPDILDDVIPLISVDNGVFVRNDRKNNKISKIKSKENKTEMKVSKQDTNIDPKLKKTRQ